MNCRNRLAAIGKLLFATFLVLPTSIAPAKAEVPNAPSSLFAVVRSDFVQINWIDNSSNESNFRVQIHNPSFTGVTQTFNVQAVSGRGTRTAINITDLAPGAYRYSVCVDLPSSKVICKIGTQTFVIPQTSANIPQTSPNINKIPTASAPTNLSANRVGASTARISWSHPGANSFLVYVLLPGRNRATLAATVGGNERQADIAPLLINTNYPAFVCARNSSGQETCSSRINVFLRQGF